MSRPVLPVRLTFTGSQFILVASVLTLFVLAFLPTLLIDYVTPDQWRAFRYSIEDTGGTERFKPCLGAVLPFHVATGRVLVWPGECIEHFFIGRISDFRKERPLSLLLALATTMSIAFVLREIVEQPALALMIAALTTYSPAFVFMYHQGLGAAPVQLAAILGAFAFAVLNRVDFQNIAKMRTGLKFLLASIVLVVLGDLMYPAYAAISVGFALIYAGFDLNVPFPVRARRFLCHMAWYAVASLVYLITSKAVIAFFFHRYPQFMPVLDSVRVGQYSLDPSIEPSLFISKLKLALDYFFNRFPLSAFYKIPAVIKYVLVGGFLLISSVYGRPFRFSGVPWARLVLSAIAFISGIIVMVAPWYVSAFTDLGVRQAFPWALALAATCVILTTHLFRLFWPNRGPLAQGCLVFVMIFVPSTARQLKASFDYTLASHDEISFLRTALKPLVASGDIHRIHRLHVIRPSGEFRVDGSLRTGIDEDETRTQTTVADPTCIRTMIIAVFREFVPFAELRTIRIHDCLFDKNCPATISPGAGLVLTQAVATDTSPVEPGTAIVDFRLAEALSK